MPAPVYVQPSDGWVGDVIPFCADGVASLYYLHDRRNGQHAGTSWHRYDTADFAEYVYRGRSLPHGAVDAPDLNAYTGSIVTEGGRLHAFYTGFNAALREPGQPARQLVMHATSANGGSWRKHPEHTFGSPAGYEPTDFRDPFVFRPEPGGPWHLLVIARRDGGADRTRGVILDYVSTDLAGWVFNGEFWAPNRYVAVECPEVFELDGRWYLVYSEFSERFATRYRIGATPFGPWVVPDADTVDGRAFYAAKSLAHDGHRYFAGWIPTKAGERDDGAWEWAGSLAVHEASARADGSLAFTIPGALAASFTDRKPLDLEPVLGEWRRSGDGCSASVPDGLAVAVSREAPDQFLLEGTIEPGPGTSECGVLLRASADGAEGYLIRLEPRRNRLVFDRWPRQRTGPAQWQISGDVPFAAELERPLDCTGGRHRLRIVVDGTACVTYVDDQVAMSARMYDRRTGGVGLFVGEGAATFTEVSMATR